MSVMQFSRFGRRVFSVSAYHFHNTTFVKENNGKKTQQLPSVPIEDFGHANLPKDRDWFPPSGYKYLWLEDEDTATLVPNGWYPVVGSWKSPYGIGFTYGIGKEDIITRGYLDTGVTIQSFTDVFPNDELNFDAIGLGKVLLENELGPDLLNYINSIGSLKLNGDETAKLFKIRPLNNKPLFQGFKIGEDVLVISGNMFKYDQGSTGTFDVPPIDIYYSFDIFCWKKVGRLMKVLYECPLDNMNTDRTHLETIRGYSIFNYYQQQSQFVNGTLQVKEPTEKE